MYTDIEIEKKIINVLKTCFDPEIPVNIYDLGLIYKLTVNEGDVLIDMTLTSPNCPSIEELPEEVEDRVKEIEGVKSLHLDLVWDPPFTQDMISDEAKLTMGLL